MQNLRIASVVSLFVTFALVGGCDGREPNSAAATSNQGSPIALLPTPLSEGERLASAAPASQPPIGSQVSGSEYFPDQPCTFEYKLDARVPGQETPSQSMVIQATEHVRSADRTYTKQVTKHPGGSSAQYERVADAGVYELSGNWERLKIRFPIAVGDEWADGDLVANTIEGFEDVTVPAGKYSKCLKVRMSLTFPNGMKANGYRYFAPNVGEVKQSIVVPNVMTMETMLQKRTIAENWSDGSFDLDHWAKCEAQNVIDHWYTRCGENQFTKQSEHFSGRSGGRIIERKRVTCRKIDPNDISVFARDIINEHTTVTEADRLNGIDWKGVLGFYDAAYREHSGGKWEKWQPQVKDDAGRPIPFACVTVHRENGKWFAELLKSDPILEFGYQPVDCQTIETFTPPAKGEVSMQVDLNNAALARLKQIAGACSTYAAEWSDKLPTDEEAVWKYYLDGVPPLSPFGPVSDEHGDYWFALSGKCMNGDGKPMTTFGQSMFPDKQVCSYDRATFQKSDAVGVAFFDGNVRWLTRDEFATLMKDRANVGTDFQLPDRLSAAQEDEIKMDFRAIKAAVSEYRDNNRYLPADLPLLNLSEPLRIDPWGTLYRYVHSTDGQFNLMSAGPDKKFGTSDDLDSKMQAGSV